MEFEKSIYRVYERSVESFADSTSETGVSKYCHVIEMFLGAVLTMHVVQLVLFHGYFVGNAGCLPDLLAPLAVTPNLNQSLSLNSSYAASYEFDHAPLIYTSEGHYKLADDAVLQVFLGETMRRYRVQAYEDVNSPSADMDASLPFMDNFSSLLQSTAALSRRFALTLNRLMNDCTVYLTRSGNRGRLRRSAAMASSSGAAAAAGGGGGGVSPSGSNSGSSSSLSHNASADFEFSVTPSLLALPAAMRREHHFNAVNVTMQGSACFGSDSVQGMLPSDGVDVIVLNSIAYTFMADGVMRSNYWFYYDIEESELAPQYTSLEFLGSRVYLLIVIGFSFMFISATTALMIRVLISSGVVIVFPIFWLFQVCTGDTNLLNARVISLSYPWIGIPMENVERANREARQQRMRAQLQQNNNEATATTTTTTNATAAANATPTATTATPTATAPGGVVEEASYLPLIIGHIVRLVVYYFMFQAAQLASSLVFFPSSHGSRSEDLWMFAVMMMAEYFSMIYVRSVQSIRVFPRATLSMYIVYNLYVYIYPTGFHLLALFVFFIAQLLLMLLCVTRFEVDALYRGEVSSEHPRALCSPLPWPVWPAALPPDFSLFMPLAARARDAYGQPTGTRPETAAAGIAAAGGIEGAEAERELAEIEEEEEEEDPDTTARPSGPSGPSGPSASSITSSLGMMIGRVGVGAISAAIASSNSSSSSSRTSSSSGGASNSGGGGYYAVPSSLSESGGSEHAVEDEEKEDEWMHSHRNHWNGSTTSSISISSSSRYGGQRRASAITRSNPSDGGDSAGDGAGEEGVELSGSALLRHHSPRSSSTSSSNSSNGSSSSSNNNNSSSSNSNQEEKEGAAY